MTCDLTPCIKFTVNYVLDIKNFNDGIDKND